jgi:putative nucleotidyltransferase with HDIG domain
MPDRNEAWALVCEYTPSEQLRKHMLAVEAALRGYARHFGADEELWGLVGLVHDFDYERFPDVATNGHPNVGAGILREKGWPEEIVIAVLSHATEVTGVERRTQLERALFACDELTGLIMAVGYVRPSKNLADVTVSSVRKKWKDKAFAGGVNRAEIEHGAAELGVPLDEHIGHVLAALQSIAPALGLDGRMAGGAQDRAA